MNALPVRWIIAVVGSIALAFSIAFSLLPGAETKAERLEVCVKQAKPAPLDFTIKDVNGKDVQMASFRGKVILLNFWATWCGPCKIEIPMLVELQNEYRDKGLVVLGLSVDDPVPTLKPFVEAHKMNYPVLVGLGRDDVQDAYGPMWGIPVTVVIGRDGMICRKHSGLASKDRFERMIKVLLDEG